MIAYLLLTHISRMFSSMPGLAGGIARDIREGTLKQYLIQPIDMIGYLLSYRVAHKVAYIVTSFLPYAPAVLRLPRLLRRLPRPADAGWPIAVSLVLAFLVGFFFEASVGMVGFWFLEVTSLLYIVMTFNFFISGPHVPARPAARSPGSGLLKALPFQYMAYFPAVVFLGKVQGLDAGLAPAGASSSGRSSSCVLARALYRLGLRRYSAYGG